MSDDTKEYVRILLYGKPASGKTTCIGTYKDLKKVLYINGENLKAAPFKKTGIGTINLSDNGILSVLDVFKLLQKNCPYDAVALDSLSGIMEVFEETYETLPIPKEEKDNKYSLYRNYMKFVKAIFAESSKIKAHIIITCHLDTTMESDGQREFKSTLSGKLGKQGIEQYFDYVFLADCVDTDTLQRFEKHSDGLNISKDEIESTYKYVLQLKRAPNSEAGKTLRSPKDVFGDKEIYVDNNINYIFDKIDEFYKI